MSRLTSTRLAAALTLALALGAAAPARAQVIGFDVHLNGGVGALHLGSGSSFTTDKPPTGIDLGISTGLLPLLRLQVFAAGMSSFNHDLFFSLGGRLLYALSDHFDLGVAANAGYTYALLTKIGGLGWMAGPHLQFRLFIVNLYFQPTFTNNIFGGGTAFYPLYGGIGIEL